MIKNICELVDINLHLFDDGLNTQTTLLSGTGNDLSPEMKTYYHDSLIDNAEPKLVHDQFGMKAPIPKGRGKTIEFRKYSPLPKALTPLQEGVTPAGNKLNVSVVTATVDQYGDYIRLSDILMLTAIDRNVDEATKLLGAQAGRTLDTVTREVLHGGSNKMIVPKVSNGTETPVLLRADITAGCLLTVDAVEDGRAKLRRMNTEEVEGGGFVAIIHTDTATDIRKQDGWLDLHRYDATTEIFSGEIGKIGGVRFVETTEAKIIAPGDMLGLDGYNRTTVKTKVESSTDVYPTDPFTTDQATAINAAISGGATYKMYIDSTECTVASVVGGAAGTCKIVLTGAISKEAGTMICGLGAGKDGSAIYCTLLIGANAYGVTDVEGGGLQHIVKQLGSGGTTDPLNQRATTGWKALKVAERLVEEYMLRIEHTVKKYRLTAQSN